MKELYKRYGSFVAVAIVLFFSFNVVKPVILLLIDSAVIAYIFYPVYKFIDNRLRKRNISAFLMVVLVGILVVLPLLFILNNLVREIPTAYSWASSTIRDSTLGRVFISEKIQEDFGISIDLGRLIESASTTVLKYVQGVLTSLPNRIFNLVISSFFLFFFFRDGYGFVRRLVYYLPFGKKNNTIIIRELKDTMDAVIYGQIITALIQFVLVTVAYSILGVKLAFFWGIMTFIFSLIPLIGPAFIYVPLSLRGVVLLGFGLGIVSSVDNVIKPMVISDKVSIHPLLVLIGVIGGIANFGVVGIMLGPLILVFLITLLNIYEMKEDLVEHMEQSRGKIIPSTPGKAKKG